MPATPTNDYLLTEETMLKFPTQLGLEIFVTQAGLICFEQEDYQVTLTIGQLRALIKNADALIADAETAKAAYQSGDKND